MHTDRVVLRLALLAVLLGGCVELGLIDDGTSISVGRPSGGRIVDGKRLPDHGVGFFTQPTWKNRGNRYGTDELIDLITGVSARIAPRAHGVRLVVADLSKQGGGAARQWHRSHQNGRDVDLLYFQRDARGEPIEAEKMLVFGPDGVARDGTGVTIDIARTWLLVKELITAPEATVQWVFMYQPIADKLIEHAFAIGEPEWLIARARLVAKQPGDSAPHHDHMHVRIYCSRLDRLRGCIDIGPMDALAEREAELANALSRPVPLASGGTSLANAMRLR